MAFPEMAYQVIDRGDRQPWGPRSRPSPRIRWWEIVAASDAGRAVVIPLEGALMSDIASALYRGAAVRGYQIHIRALPDGSAVECWVEPQRDRMIRRTEYLTGM